MKNCMNYDSLPEVIREQCGFCCWRRENRNGRVTKVPYTPTSGNYARSNDVKTFRPFDVALTAYNNSQESNKPYDGLGICVDGNIGAIDIDHCIEGDKLNDVATAVLGAFNDCYFEVSPSGTGLRGFFQVSPDFQYDTAHYYMKNSTYGLEIYLPGHTSRFVTVTGDVYQDGPVSTDMDALQIILDTFMLRDTPPDDSTTTASSENVTALITPHSYLTDEEVIEKASKSSNGALFADLYKGLWQEHMDKYPSQSEADMAFASMLAFWCGCDFEQMDRIFEASGLYREKWERQQSGSTYGAITLESAIKKCKSVYSPRSAATDDFDAIGNDSIPSDYVSLMDSIAEETASILRLSDEEAENRITTMLTGTISSADFYADDTIALIVRIEESAPHLYDEFRTKAKASGIRLAVLDRKVKKLQALVSRAKDIFNCTTNKPVPPFVFFNPRKGCLDVSCPKLADYVRTHLHYLLVKDETSKVSIVMKYVYENGCYRLCTDDRFRGHIKKFIEDFDNGLVKMTQVDEVYRQILTDLKVTDHSLLNEDENVINFRNGILNLDTMVLQPHSPDILSTIQIPCIWNGSALPTPVFDDFMKTLTDNNADLQRLLLQFMGVCLSNIKGSRLKKALFLLGEGDTGKSQLKSLTERLVGAENCIGIDLDRMEKRFGTSAIYGKRLAGSSDMKFMTIGELGVFKQCTGGDMIGGEFKGLPLFNFSYDGLLWFCTNRAPKFGGDQGDWVYERMMLVFCHNVIPKEKQDKHLLDKMYSERDGIVSKAVMALKKVIDNGYRFDEPNVIAENRHAYKLQNNSVLYFFEECMQERQNARISRSDKFTVKRVYDVYRSWSEMECDGYYSKFSEFKERYSEFCGKPVENCIGERNGGKYLLFHELTPELYEDSAGIGDPSASERYPNVA